MSCQLAVSTQNEKCDFEEFKLWLPATSMQSRRDSSPFRLQQLAVQYLALEGSEYHQLEPDLEVGGAVTGVDKAALDLQNIVDGDTQPQIWYDFVEIQTLEYFLHGLCGGLREVLGSHWHCIDQC